MIRIFIVADNNDRADDLARLLEEDHRFEISEIELADVILAIGIPLRRLPMRGKTIVGISRDNDGDAPFDETLRAWLPASASLEEITSAITSAVHGLTVLTGQQARRTFRSMRPTHDDGLNVTEHLTARELEVLQMLAAGLGNKEIAARLRISLNTSKFHVRQILAKLNAESRTEAVSTAIRRGLVPI